MWNPKIKMSIVICLNINYFRINKENSFVRIQVRKNKNIPEIVSCTQRSSYIKLLVTKFISKDKKS